ncbi:hypothetical protein A2153_03685 [Candidatus Gottesmanbacteria bacterium RBG_16_38_7b]|uniref:Uncharacterized protein n=1 Tax=Candidatus Gottesmanbacteria bacterium RBG_16_38_7b TaxID=1798372 RepID=A0A1F5YHK9_9BACT|nr:MAG: hypothetical protein A2153_03685 [Candidatus Gottesmanbacteria bacterium RBG_16_38_7b]
MVNFRRYNEKRMNNADRYLQKISKVISLTIDIAGYEATGKEKIREEMFKTYLENSYLNLAVRLKTGDREQLLQIVKSDSDDKEKFKKINLFLEGRVDESRITEAITDEVENIMKKLIKAANTALNGETKDLYNKQVVSILTQ